MKDVFEVKRSADGDDVLKSLNGQFKKIIDVTDATYQVDDADTGAIFVLNRPGGIVVTLPAVEPGLEFEFIVKTTFTGTFSLDSASTDDLFVGALTIQADDAQDESFLAIPDVSDDDKMVMDADTKGRLVGGTFKCVGISTPNSSAAAAWYISGVTHGTGATLASPFA